MSIIRPLTITSMEISHAVVQRQVEASSLHSSEFHHDLETQAAADTAARQKNITRSDNKKINNDDPPQDYNPLSSYNHHSHEDTTMQFYTSKESVKPSLGSKHLVDADDASTKESDDSYRKEDDSDDGPDSFKPTLQSLASHAGQVIGQAIGMGVGGFSLSGNSGGSATTSLATSSGSSGKDTAASLQVTPSTVGVFSQEISSETEALSQPQESSKSSLSDSEGNTILGAALSTNNVITPMISDTRGDGSLSSSSMLQEGIPKPIAAAVRSAQFSDSLMNELTATVQTLRLNKANGQDMTLNLRSDVLEATSIHITGSATHVTVDFFTANAASNLLLNTHLVALQNHLAELCPTQLVDIRTQFVGQTSPRDFSSSSNSGNGDDLASFDQGNRGSKNHDDSL